MVVVVIIMIMTMLCRCCMQECADQRLKRGTELLQNIKALKLFVWERLMAKRVENARRTQLTFLLKAACLKAAVSK